jgi:hypothetical protein
MIISEEELQGQYGFSSDMQKDETECRKCVYLEGLNIETKINVCKICDQFKMSGKEHMRKHEDIKYNRKEIVKLLLDIP